MPYRCHEYIADLEAVIEGLMKTQMEGLTVLGELAKIKARHTAELAWAGQDAAALSILRAREDNLSSSDSTPPKSTEGD